jgi:large subunit ribosomal protein L29
VKLRELRDLGEAELRARATELADELFHLRLRRATSQLPNPMKVRETRRELARVRTLLGERARGAGGRSSEARG